MIATLEGKVALVAGAGRGIGRWIAQALAGLETACWDIKGKIQGQPVWQLLGSQGRDRVRCYAWCSCFSVRRQSSSWDLPTAWC